MTLDKEFEGVGVRFFLVRLVEFDQKVYELFRPWHTVWKTHLEDYILRTDKING